MKKIKEITLNILPILVMVGLIPLIHNDYWLSFVYIVIIVTSLLVKRSKNDLLFFVFGAFAMMVSESVFVRTGAEDFQRNSLFGLMPVWLPILWGYGFVVIKRSIEVLSR